MTFQKKSLFIISWGSMNLPFNEKKKWLLLRVEQKKILSAIFTYVLMYIFHLVSRQQQKKKTFFTFDYYFSQRSADQPEKFSSQSTQSTKQSPNTRQRILLSTRPTPHHPTTIHNHYDDEHSISVVFLIQTSRALSKSGSVKKLKQITFLSG